MCFAYCFRRVDVDSEMLYFLLTLFSELNGFYNYTCLATNEICRAQYTVSGSPGGTILKFARKDVPVVILAEECGTTVPELWICFNSSRMETLL